MTRYYLNSGDAYRLKLFVDPIVPLPETNENAITNTTGDDSVAISDNITIPDDTLGDSTAMSEVVNVASASDGIIADGHNDVANTLETLSIGHEN